MSKITLDPIGSGYNLSKMNDNFERIATVINDKMLSRSPSGEPNHMDDVLDMNSNPIINLPQPSSATEPVRLQDIPGLVNQAQGANYVGEEPPVSTFNGLRWYKPSEATTFVYYVDGDSGQWVQEPVVSADSDFELQLAAAGSTKLVSGQQAQVIAQLVEQLNARTKTGMVYGDNTAYRYRVISAVIRNTGSGWFIINDATHEPTGLQSVSVQPDGTLLLVHNVGATQVGSLVAVPDETFAQWGLIVGGSIGNFSSLLTLTAPLDFLVNTSTGTVTAPSYLGNAVTGTVGGGTCTVTHPSVLSNTVASAQQVGSANKVDITVSYGPTSVVIDGVGDVDGYIRWDGANWLYTGNLRTPPTFSWSAGELTVTHPNCDQFNLNLVGREDGLRVGAGSVDKTSFKVRFYDAAGNQVTTLSTLMKFYVSRRASALKTTLEGNVAVKRGYVKLDANDVVSATGNIWIYGLMVV